MSSTAVVNTLSTTSFSASPTNRQKVWNKFLKLCLLEEGFISILGIFSLRKLRAATLQLQTDEKKQRTTSYPKASK